MRIGRFIPTFLFFLTVMCGTSRAGDSLFQYATINTLLAGMYDGRMTLRELKYQGDFGLGTLNGLNGELILLEGQAYHAAVGGNVDVPDDRTSVPFATVSFFSAETTVPLGSISSLTSLNAAIAKVLPSPNLFCAIRIDGDFSLVKVRAIPRQKKPYRPLTEVVKSQKISLFSGQGTLIGYYSPPFVKGLNVTGFHWHFLTKDRRGGGHVLDCTAGSVEAQLDPLQTFTVRLPDDVGFRSLDLTGDRGSELYTVEIDPAGKE